MLNVVLQTRVPRIHFTFQMSVPMVLDPWYIPHADKHATQSRLEGAGWPGPRIHVEEKNPGESKLLKTLNYGLRNFFLKALIQHFSNY